LSRFSGAAYEQSLQRHLKEKYQDRPIGVVVTVGAATLELVLRWREELWPETPSYSPWSTRWTFARLKPPPDVTGTIVKLGLADSITVARAVVPELKTIALVGDQWDRQVIFQNWKDELPTAAAGLNVVEIVGQTMPRFEGVSPNCLRTASFSIRRFIRTAKARSIAHDRNRTHRREGKSAYCCRRRTILSPGGIGGYVLVPSLIGADAAEAGAADSRRRAGVEHAGCGDGRRKADFQLEADATVERQPI